MKAERQFPDMEDSLQLELVPRKAVWVLVLSMLAVLFLHGIACAAMPLLGREEPLGLLNVDGEKNLPTMFSIALLWCNALLVGYIARCQKGRRVEHACWMGLTLAFFLVGLDEGAMIHERFSNGTKQLFNASGAFSFSWVIPYLVLLLVFVAVYARFFFRLPADTRRRILIAGMLYVGGGIGVEMLGGARWEQHGKDTAYYLLATVEEMLEMTGAIVFINAWLKHIALYCPSSLHLRIASNGIS